MNENFENEINMETVPAENADVSDPESTETDIPETSGSLLAMAAGVIIVAVVTTVGYVGSRLIKKHKEKKASAEEETDEESKGKIRFFGKKLGKKKETKNEDEVEEG